MKRQLKQFPQYKQNEQSHKKTPYISVFVIIFTLEIIGTKKTKVLSHGIQTWLISPMSEWGYPYV